LGAHVGNTLRNKSDASSRSAIFEKVRVTSHTKPRARDQYTSSTLIGGKGGARPSSLYTTLEGPTMYVNAR
jgi:hypothetical protein